ncbi:hypothetical protein L249_4229 [Ophiocordyceps polyrhachis-furcata BCC 54312]|uniref:RRM domain-containing protein n=1 Tax=Ophiocordyceps polyrhachis-furcata BCC 54312 TaxID=1330021 RepID=A0A367LCD3_9HYPO|nr:hypothetical protein L249_4229 [Ophiocordyceps polyrhachis-furcata BCC 54312]
MSAPAPQVLSRRAHHGPPTETPAKGKSTTDSHPQRPSRGAFPGEKSQDAVKSEPSKRTKPRPVSQGEKLVIRRLPPGMTEAEAVSILGAEWEVNKGKVDWFSFCSGKVSVDPSKPSRPGRAYLHLLRKDDMMALSQVVRSATWEDAKSTFTSPSLVGPPSLEFATYKKIPSTRRRIDPRQGTIDQDPEFMAFLEGLANPVPFRESLDADDAEDGSKEDGKITTTPLVEFLKEKRANKGKENVKSAKTGPAKGRASEDATKKKTRDAKADKSTKEPVKILTKKPTAEPAPEVAAPAADGAKGRRAGIAAAARILQRDLGLSPGSAHRRARHDAAKAEAVTSKEPTASANEAAQPSPTTPKTTTTATKATTKATEAATSSPKPPQPPPNRRVRNGKAADRGKATESQPTTTPVILKKRGDDEVVLPATVVRSPASKPAANGKPPTATSTNNTASKTKAPPGQKKAPAVTAGATRAFVKHVNASQGVTEAVLRQALEAFGTVTLVEVDRRKGFAYVDFADHDGLVKAIGAGPVQVAQSAVQVVERREKKASSSAPEKGPPGRGRRGRGGGGGGKAAATNGTANGPAPTLVASTGGSG